MCVTQCELANDILRVGNRAESIGPQTQILFDGSIKLVEKNRAIQMGSTI